MIFSSRRKFSGEAHATSMMRGKTSSIQGGVVRLTIGNVKLMNDVSFFGIRVGQFYYPITILSRGYSKWRYGYLEVSFWRLVTPWLPATEVIVAHNSWALLMKAQCVKYVNAAWIIRNASTLLEVPTMEKHFGIPTAIVGSNLEPTGVAGFYNCAAVTG